MWFFFFITYAAVWKREKSSLLDPSLPNVTLFSVILRNIWCAPPMGSLGKVSNRLEGPNCVQILHFSFFFFFAAEPCFGRSRVENFQNSWGGNPFPIRGKSRHRDASCKRSSKQTRKEAFPPRWLCINQNSAHARDTMFFTSAAYVHRNLCGWRRAWQFTLILLDFI